MVPAGNKATPFASQPYHKSNSSSSSASSSWLKLILNPDQGLAFFRQKQILTGLLVTKIFRNRTMKTS